MAYLGNESQANFSFVQKQTFNGDNSTTDFQLRDSVGLPQEIQVYVENVRQEPTAAYTVSGKTLSFTEAPPTGTGNIYVVFQQPTRTALVTERSIDGTALQLQFNFNGTSFTTTSANTNIFSDHLNVTANAVFSGANNTITSANTVFDGHVLFTGTVKSVGSQTGFGDPLTVDTIATANGVVLGRNTTFDKATRNRITNVLNVGGDGFGTSTLTLSLANSNHFYCELANNITLANPTNVVAGQSGAIVLKQDTTGSRTISFGTNWKFPSGVAPTLSTSANTADRLDYFVSNTFYIHAVATLNVS